MATSNFAFEVKYILGLESTHLESGGQNRVKWPPLLRIFFGSTHDNLQLCFRDQGDPRLI